jgi:hypothetical protein
MPICGRVISKPGYSTFAEAMRLQVPIVSLTREDVAESPLLLSGIQNYAHHQIIVPEEFFQDSWEFLRRDPDPPLQSASLPTDGTEVIARAVIDYFNLA